ncbi:TetR/AcrR family transcriptional regulator [Novosphingobium profundi]|uniref:TetR/AcrR family transcriptional regulator n=1 Tax=Novosphingobium profundi TaxID=1774954 RepID=UPI001BD9EF65|nr:TetR/AcrR family transcriptional regulator [Novosphingobium profundi]MBT0671185.1 TetR/AcrR family transcriptional regulator [Novosphingobium profundi]
MDKNLTALKQDRPTDARQVRSRNALNSALLALLGERAFDELTIREISARAGTGYATFFRHFATKEALLSDLVSEPIERLAAQIVPLFEGRRDALSPLQLCRLIEEELALWSALLTGGAASIIRAEFIQRARNLSHDLDTGNDWLPAELALVHGVSSTLDVLTWWLRHHGDVSLGQVATILHRMVIAPLTQETIDVQLS